MKSWFIVAAIVFGLAGRSWAGDCPAAKRAVFDPPGKRHSLPQLAFDGKYYTIVGYDGPPLQMYLSTYEGYGRPTANKLAAGGLAATATDGRYLGIVFLATSAGRKANDAQSTKPPGGDRYQTYFTVVNRDGRTLVPRIALGDPDARHSAPGAAIAWNPQAKEWGVLWMEGVKLSFARLDPKGKILGTRELSQSGTVNPQGHLVWTGTTWAYVMPSRYGLSLLEFDDQHQHETTIAVASAYEPVLAFSNGVYGIAFRTNRELAFVRVKNGKELGRTVLATVPGQTFGQRRPSRPTPGGPSAPPTPPTAPAPRLGSISLASTGAGWVVVWAVSKGTGFDDRLMVARLDELGTFAGAPPRRLDDEEKHQGYASIAGTGCSLAVSYVLGDPNGDVRVGFTRLP